MTPAKNPSPFRLLILTVVFAVALAGCSAMRGRSVDRMHITKRPVTQEEIDSRNTEFETISKEGFALKKKWHEEGNDGAVLEYWHFRRPWRSADEVPPSPTEPGTEPGTEPASSQ